MYRRLLILKYLRRKLAPLFAAVAVTGWTMGMARENRITYILFPFLIPLALETLRAPRLQRIARAPAGWGAALAVGLIGSALGLRIL